jgi:hypothetical protein
MVKNDSVVGFKAKFSEIAGKINYRIASVFESLFPKDSKAELLFEKLKTSHQLVIDVKEGNILLEYEEKEDSCQFGMVAPLGKVQFFSSSDKQELKEKIYKYLQVVVDRPYAIYENQIKNAWGEDQKEFETFKKSLTNKGLLIFEDDSVTFYKDKNKSSLVTFEGADKDRKLDLYLKWLYEYGPDEVIAENINKKKLSTFEKMVLGFIGTTVLTGVLMVPYKAAIGRLALFRNSIGQNNVLCNVGLVASSLFVLRNPNNKEMCIGMVALSCLPIARGEIVVKNPVPDQKVLVNQPFSLNIDLNSIFTQTNPDLTLDLSLSVNNNATLPTWMNLKATPELVSLLGNFAASAIDVEGNRAYLAGDRRGVGIVDISSKKPNLQGMIPVFDSNGVDAVNYIVYITDLKKGLVIADASDAKNATVLSSILSNGNGVWVRDNIAYVADEDFAALDVSDLKKPVVLGLISSHGAQKPFLLDDKAYIPSKDVGLDIIKITDPQDLQRLGTLIGIRDINSVFVAKNLRAYLTALSHGLIVADVSNPAKQFVVLEYGSNVYSAVVSGKKVYLIKKDGLEILDISEDDKVKSLGMLEMNNGYDLKLRGDQAFVADNVNGLDIVDIYKWHLSGSPSCSDGSKTYQVSLQVKNDLGENAVNSFAISIQNIDPWVAHPIGDQRVHIGTQYSFQVPKNTFEGVCSKNFTLSAFQEDGKELPPWLEFDPVLNILKGRPSKEESIGKLQITIMATDENKKSAKCSFGLDVFKNGIQVNGSIPDQNTFVKGCFKYTFDSKLFIDGDEASLTYSAADPDGNPLSWVKFNAESRTFSGNPQKKNLGKTLIRLSAKDDYSQAYVDFAIKVADKKPHPPVINKGIKNRKSKVGDLLEFKIDDDAFSDPDNYKLTYNAFLKDKKPLPDWLHFIIDTCTFEGKSTKSGILEIIVTATDPFGQEADTSFSITIENKKSAAGEDISLVGSAFVGLGAAVSAIFYRDNLKTWVNRKKCRVETGEDFNYEIERLKAEDVGSIKVFKTNDKKSKAQSILSLFRNDWEDVDEEEWSEWLEHEEFSNQFRTKEKVTADRIGKYKITFFDKHKKPKEEIILDVQEPSIPFNRDYRDYGSTGDSILLTRYDNSNAKMVTYEDDEDDQV